MWQNGESEEERIDEKEKPSIIEIEYTGRRKGNDDVQ